MDLDTGYWDAVTELRLRIADLLEPLSPREWDGPSLCRGWRVRDLTGHLAVVPTLTLRQMLAVAPRAGFDPNRINTLVATREGSREPQELVDRLRRYADEQHTARLLDPRNTLFDLVVHSQDIALPLGRDFPVPVDLVHRGLARVWEMGWPFSARKKLAGVSLRATDTDWRVGAGPEVAGPALALLLLLTGRARAAAGNIHGPGVPAVTSPT